MESPALLMAEGRLWCSVALPTPVQISHPGFMSARLCTVGAAVCRVGACFAGACFAGACFAGACFAGACFVGETQPAVLAGPSPQAFSKAVLLALCTNQRCFSPHGFEGSFCLCTVPRRLLTFGFCTMTYEVSIGIYIP